MSCPIFLRLPPERLGILCDTSVHIFRAFWLVCWVVTTWTLQIVFIWDVYVYPTKLVKFLYRIHELHSSHIVNGRAAAQELGASVPAAYILVTNYLPAYIRSFSSRLKFTKK